MSGRVKIEDLIKEQGFSVSTTVGMSMYPMLRNRRDTIVIRSYKGRLKKFDVPLYRSNGDYVLHRIIHVLPDAYIIRGDNCIRKEYVTDDMIIGVLSEFYRGSKPVNMKGFGYKAYVKIWNCIFPFRYTYKMVRRICGRLKTKMLSFSGKG